MDTPSIDARQEGIGHAIADKKPVIPTRQRSYAWTKEEVNELFSDIAAAIAKPKPDYFLGLIVAVRKDGNGRPEVVDGQQRLATCAMLLAAIRDHFFDANAQSKHAAKYATEFLIDYDDQEGTEVPHLKLNLDDNKFFLDYVLRPPNDPKRVALAAAENKKQTRSTRNSNKLIREAAEIARKRVRDTVNLYPPSEREKVLVRWVEFIRNHAKILWFEVPDYSSAYTIFETLNDRGLDLSKSDLLKNYLFGCVGDRHEEVHQPWSKMVGIIETVSKKDIAATYVRHFWISTHGPVRERQLFNEIKNEVQGGVESAIGLAQSLETHAMSYAAILSSDHEAWSGYGEEARENVRHLVMLQAERIRPLLLAVVKHFEESEIKKAMRLFENWTVRLIISSKLGGVVEGTIGELAKEISDKTITTVKLLARHKKVGTAIPSDNEFEAAFSVARVAKHELARYYLEALEEKHKHTLIGEETTTRPSKKENVCTLEHILPENPSAEWGFSTPAKLQEAMEDVHCIGNLLLLHKKLNEGAANKTLAKKLPHYKLEKGLYLTASFAEKYSTCLKWGHKEIDERQKELAKLAVKTWPLKV